jgi:hypothetical protein
MATTTNYGWTTPNDTDLVKDGASAIRTLGSSIDTTVKALSPGTTAGDLDYYTSGTAKARLGIGTAGQILQVNSGATAPEWATPGGGENFTLLNAGGTTLNGGTTTVSGISGANKIFVVIQSAGQNVISSIIGFRLNTDTGSNYDAFAGTIAGASAYSSGIVARQTAFNGTSFTIAQLSNDVGSNCDGYIMIDGCNAAGLKPVMFATGVFRNTPGTTQVNYTGGGVYKGTSTISSISLITTNDFNSLGTIYVYTSA